VSLPPIGLLLVWTASWPVTTHVAWRRHRSPGWALVTAILFGWLAPLVYGRLLSPQQVSPPS
jgi:hypothetical protein